MLVLDDAALDRAGRIEPPDWWIEQHDGRQGSTRLVNGRREPELTMAAGQIERWRIVNAASARYVRLSLGGRPVTLVGTDGGLLTAPVMATEVLLPPSARVELAVGPFVEGDTFVVESLPYDRKSANRQRKAERIATVHVGPAMPSVAAIPVRLRDIAPLVTGPVVTGPVAPTRDRPGEWMYHCRFVEHHASGMMGHCAVVR